ncbi:MAG: hypothetical protein WC623_22215 [Pedobacter sp.]|uniref:hypothetical protein n=1 Tax=Pedobacter sp. TaxID=1411316 RepID=UPI00356AE1EC
MTKQDKGNLLKILAIVAVVLVGYWMFTAPSSTPTPTTGSLLSGQISPQGGEPVRNTVIVQQAAAPVSMTPVTGTITLKPLSATGASGVTSNMVLLDQSYAVYNERGAFDEQATRYKIMKQIADYGVSTLKSYAGGQPAILTPSSGAWSQSITGAIGDKFVVFTAVGASLNTAPAKEINASTAKLATITDFNRATENFFVTLNDGKSTWSLFDYAAYNFTDTTFQDRTNYTVGDGGTAAVSQTVTFYSNATATGAGCFDCAIYMKADKNYTSKFKDLVISARAVKPGSTEPSSVKFTSLRVGDTDLAAQVLPSANTTEAVYFVGYIPDNFDTVRTASDKNHLTWTLTTDTYGSDEYVRLYIVHNARAMGTTNGIFDADPEIMEIQLSNSASSGFDVAI